jgi:hypothetical protein
MFTIAVVRTLNITVERKVVSESGRLPNSQGSLLASVIDQSMCERLDVLGYGKPRAADEGWS